MYKMKINDMEMVEIQTHIKLVNKAYVKMQQQRSVVENMEQEFQEFFWVAKYMVILTIK